MLGRARADEPGEEGHERGEGGAGGGAGWGGGGAAQGEGRTEVGDGVREYTEKLIVGVEVHGKARAQDMAMARGVGVAGLVGGMQ